MTLKPVPGIDRREFLRSLGVGAAAAATPGYLRGAAGGGRRPNIVLILADDMGYSDIGCFGSEIRTPNIDSLAARGLRFTQFYNGAVCCPTRAALLTGLYSHQAGMGWMTQNGADTRPHGPYQGFLNDRCVTLAEVLRSAGYRTLMSGKWHVGENRPHWPVDRGFDRSFGLISGAANYFDITKDYLPHTVRQMALDGAPYHPPRTGFYMTDAIADRSVEFLAEAAEKPDPFFLYLPFTAPHFPLHAPEAAIAKCHGRYHQGWDVMRQARFERQRALGIVAPDAVLSPRDSEVTPWDQTPERDFAERRMEIYAAQIEKMDAGIGRVLAELRRSGREEDTWIFFLSDNGAEGSDTLARFRPEKFNRPPYLGGPESFLSYGVGWSNMSDTPMRKFKTWLEEGGISTPLIAAGPGLGKPGGSLCHEPGHIVDLMATFTELAGAEYPRRFQGREILPLEGVSLVPMLRGGRSRRKRPICWELEGQYALRDGNWKILGREDKPWALYDLATDRAELHDLSAAQPERLRTMVAAYAEWKERCGVLSWKATKPHLTNVPGVG